MNQFSSVKMFNEKILHPPTPYADQMPEKPESYTQVMEDFENKIMPGVLHWNHPNFFAYFGAGNAYPSVLGDMLSSGIAAIGFSWVRKSFFMQINLKSKCKNANKVLTLVQVGIVSRTHRAGNHHA